MVNWCVYDLYSLNPHRSFLCHPDCDIIHHPSSLYLWQQLYLPIKVPNVLCQLAYPTPLWPPLPNKLKTSAIPTITQNPQTKFCLYEAPHLPNQDLWTVPPQFLLLLFHNTTHIPCQHELLQLPPPHHVIVPGSLAWYHQSCPLLEHQDPCNECFIVNTLLLIHCCCHCYMHRKSPSNPCIPAASPHPLCNQFLCLSSTTSSTSAMHTTSTTANEPIHPTLTLTYSTSYELPSLYVCNTLAANCCSPLCKEMLIFIRMYTCIWIYIDKFLLFLWNLNYSWTFLVVPRFPINQMYIFDILTWILIWVCFT